MLGLIDESTPTSARGVHYVIGAAVLLDLDHRDHVRARVAALVAGRVRPFHWRDEGPALRTRMIELLAGLDVGAFAVVHHPVAARRQAGARAAALGELASILSSEGVDELVIESRGIQDAEGRRTLVAGHAAGRMPLITYAFAGKDEPLVWLPDSVAGIVGAAECRRDAHWLERLQRAVSIFDVRRLDARQDTP